MFDIFVRVIGAVAAAWLVNEGVKAYTGNSIPQHLLRWWNAIREKCLIWLKKQPKSVQDVTRFAIVRVDNTIQRVSNLCEIQAYNEDTEEVTVVTVEKFSKEQLEELELDDEDNNCIEIEV